MPALAITDHGAMFGALQFYEAGIAAGVKPIIGVETYVAPSSRFERAPGESEEKYRHLTILARNETGYRNLLKLVTDAHLEGFYHRPRVDKELLAEHGEGLIGLSGCLASEVSQLLLGGQPAKADEVAATYADIFGAGNFFIELQDHGLSEQREILPKLVELAGRTGLPLVATNDLHYTHREDAKPHDVLLCIQQQKLQSDTNRLRFDSDEFYLKTAEEMREVFREFPEACDATLQIAEMCELELVYGSRGAAGGAVPRPEVRAAAGQGPRRLPARARDGGGAGAVRHPHPTDPRTHRAGARRHHVDGLLGLLPDRVGPDPVRARERHPRRARPGLGRGFGRVVLAADHRPRSAPVRPDLRAVPQPRADPDARHRHGLRRAPARRGDPVRGLEVRQRPRGADHHVPDDQGEAGDPRRRARARVPGERGRPALQDVPGGDHGARRADREGAAAVARAPRRVRARAGGPRDRRHRPRARGAPPGGLGARGRCRDRRRAARDVPAAQALEGLARRLAPDRHPVRHARRRGPRPAQDGLPRPPDALGDRGHALAPAAQGRRARHRPRGARRRRHLRDALPGRHHRRLPARGRRHALADQAARARPVRGPDGARRALPSGAAQRGDARRVRRTQAPASPGVVPASGPGGDPFPDVRDHGLPGAGDADRGADGRLLDGRGRHAPPGDGQEDPRQADGASREVHPGLRRQRVPGAVGPGPVRADGAVRRLRVQRLARVRVRLHRVPDRVPEGEPPGRVHVGDPDERPRRQGPQAVLPERVPADGARGAPPRRERVRTGLRAGDERRAEDPVRPVRGAERGFGRGAADHRGAAREGFVHRVRGLLPQGGSLGPDQEGAREPDLRRGVRLVRVPAAGARREPGQDLGPDLGRAQGRGRRAVLAVRRWRAGGQRDRRGRDHVRRVRQADAPAPGEGGARPVRDRPPAARGEGAAGGARRHGDRRDRGPGRRRPRHGRGDRRLGLAPLHEEGRALRAVPPGGPGRGRDGGRVPGPVREPAAPARARLDPAREGSRRPPGSRRGAPAPRRRDHRARPRRRRPSEPSGGPAGDRPHRAELHRDGDRHPQGAARGAQGLVTGAGAVPFVAGRAALRRRHVPGRTRRRPALRAAGAARHRGRASGAARTRRRRRDREPRLPTPAG